MPALNIAQKLILSYGKSSILICEPNIEKHNDFELYDYKYVYENCDISIFLVSHSIFKNLNNKKNKSIIDFCGITKL